MKTKLFKIIFFLIIINTLFVSNAFAEIFVTPLSHDYGRTENNYPFRVESSPPDLVKVGVSEKPTWVSVNPTSPFYLTVLHPYRDVTVTVNRAGLAPGSYQGTVTFAIFKTWETIPVVDVTVSMIVPNPPELSVSPDSYNFGESETSCQFSVQNTGESTLNWSATAPSWLTLDSYVGSLGQGALQFVTATVNRGTLVPGTYTGTISFTSDGGDKDVPVSMTVPEPDPELSVGPTSHDFGTSETSYQFAVTNTGGGTLNWSVSEGISWLNLSLSGGSVGSGALQFVTATVNRGGLVPGTYTGTISFTSSYGNQNVPVSMTVPEPDPELSVSPTSYDFGTSETSYQFTVTNTGGGTLNWSVSEGISWLSLSLSGGSVGSGASQFVTATVNRGGLAPGTYTGTISFTSSYGNQNVPVSMTVLDTTPPTGTISINNGDEYTDSTSVTLTLSASDNSSGVSKMQFSNDGANWSSEEDYATSKSWTLAPGDGLKTVYVQYKDNAGNWSTPPLSISDAIILDTTPPTGTISINSGAVYTSTTSVTLTLSASDSTSGVSKMKFSNDGVNWSSEEDYATSKTWTLTTGDEIKTVYVQYKNNTGRWSASINDTIVLDTTPPSGTISINGGALYADSISVILTLSASDSNGVNKMKFSNDGVNWSSEEDYAPSKTWTLTTADGIKTVYVQYKDNAGRWSGSISDTIILDATPPTGIISINNGAVYTDSTSVTLTLSASDSGSGVSKMKFSNDGANWSVEENYATSKTWTVTTGDGIKTVYVQYKDSAGNWSASISDTIILDTTPPTGTISINNGDEYTGSASVTLTLSASDSNGVSKMKFSNNGVSWSSEEDYATSKSWTVTTGDETKTVYVQYKDNAGNWSGLTSISDTIILDTTPPTGTISINGGAVYANSTSVTLTLSASDSGSGVSKMMFSNDGVEWSSEENYATGKTWVLTTDDEEKTVYVRYKDNAGKWSASISDTIILETASPTGTISINGGAAYANSASVTLTLSASDSNGVSKMKFSNDGANWSSEEDYATSKDWTLTPPGDGLKTVYVRYKDTAGNWSGLTSINDPIILDTTLPTGTISINNGAVYTSTTSVTLTLSASDPGSGVSKMQFSNDGASWSSEEDYATSKDWTLASGDGLKTVYVRYKDTAGNWSGSISDTIILDTTPPTGTISINGGDVYANSTSVILALSASDSISGVSKMKFSNDGASWSNEEDYATSKIWTLTTGDETKTVYVQYKDNVGSWSGLTAINDTIILDTTPPTGTISINNGAVYTSTTSVTLTLSASDSTSGVSKMKFSNDAVVWSSEEDYATSKIWTLTTGDETKTVYVQYKDNAGSWSVSISSDTIILETAPPTGTISINSGALYTSTTPVTLTLSASDPGSGVNKMQFSNDGVNWSGEEDSATSKAWTLTAGDGAKTVYVQYKDNAGSWSDSISDTIILDTTPPAGTILINGGAEYTNSTSVTLTLSASDSGSGVSKMQFSNDGVNWSVEEDYATGKSWTLTAGDGTKTVYVKYKDTAGSWSASINDTIILDTIVPTVKLMLDEAKARILPDGEIVGALPDMGMEAKFSKVMDTESVKEGLKLIAVKDNLNETINEEVSLDFEWEGSTKTVITPVLELKKNYLYSLKVTTTVTDLAGNTVEGEREIIFRTIMDHTEKNVIVKGTNGKLMVTLEANALAATLEANALTVTLEANALPEDGYLIINTEPLTYQFEVDPESINVANEKSITNGWYPIEGCLWEIKVCKGNGDWMEDKFGSEVKITFPYDEDNGVVDNALIPLMEETLQAFWLNEEHSNWVRVPGSIVDRENNVIVTGEVPHFSVFGLMGSAVYDLSDAHAYPVPWKPNDGKDGTGNEEGITFTNLSAEGAIKIYSISGELVREYDYKPADGGKWTWDVKTSRGEKVFSGVYIYYIKNEKEQKTGRLMIIR